MTGTSDWTFAESGGVILVHDAITEQRLSAKPCGKCILNTPRPLTDEEAAALASAIDAFIKVRDSEVSGDAAD